MTITTLSHEEVWWQNDKWAIGVFEGRDIYGRKSLFIADKKTGFVEFPVLYDNGSIGYDFPERIPRYVNDKLYTLIKKKHFRGA